jgi:hypothetical protein
MCVAQKTGPGREYAVAVDWRDCAWSPRIVVQFPAAAPVGRIRVLPPNATRMERGCVQSASRSTLKRSSVASGVFQPAGFARRLRLVCDTAALRGRRANTPSPVRRVKKQSPAASSISPPPRRNRIYF